MRGFQAAGERREWRMANHNLHAGHIPVTTFGTSIIPVEVGVRLTNRCPIVLARVRSQVDTICHLHWHDIPQYCRLRLTSTEQELRFCPKCQRPDLATPAIVGWNIFSTLVLYRLRSSGRYSNAWEILRGWPAPVSASHRRYAKRRVCSKAAPVSPCIHEVIFASTFGGA
jgi:hypothetical protein